MKVTNFKLRHINLSRAQLGWVCEIEWSAKTHHQFTASHHGTRTLRKSLIWALIACIWYSVIDSRKEITYHSPAQ